ncbi:MAG TPA: c-type cytochrome [Steroidobacteraceae bacterium]|jgi:mono/diheme cytochrome c family protein
MRNFIAGVVAGLVATALVVWLYPWRIEASGEPASAERWLMARLVDKAIAREAPHAANPFAVSDEILLEGMKFYTSGCAGCHGDGKQASIWGTTSFFPRAPQFGTHPTPRPDWQIFWIVKHGIRNTGMGGWSKLAGDDDLWKVALFLDRMDSLPPAVAARWRGDAQVQSSPPDR